MFDLYQKAIELKLHAALELCRSWDLLAWLDFHGITARRRGSPLNIRVIF